MLKDESKPNDPAGAIRVIRAIWPLTEFRFERDRGAGAVTLKLLAGQSIIGFGLVPHEILPVMSASGASCLHCALLHTANNAVSWTSDHPER